MPVTSTTSGSSPIQHPVYTTWRPVWDTLVHVYDGSGGFKDGTFLVAHPREYKDWRAEEPSIATKKLKARRALARYENVAATILDQKRSALFRESISRSVGGQTGTHPIEDWWTDVDGAGCSMDDWMADGFTYAGLFGHVVHYMDRPDGDAPLTAADQTQPFLRLYTPLDVPDWRLDEYGRLTSIRLLEAVTEDDPTKPHVSGTYRERLVTDTDWTIFERGRNSSRLKETGRGEHGFGAVPVVLQYAKRRGLAQLIGQPILGDPKLYVDLYNLTSEIRELLRNQTFGTLIIKLGTGDKATDILTAQGMLGTEKGVENIMFTPEGADYIQPDAANVTVYQAERKDLLRSIYRLAAVPWESDSRDAEAEGSMKLKREDMNQVLAAYASECQKTEIQLAQMWFRAMYGDSWEREWETAQVEITYPRTFDVTPFAEILEQATASQALPMGPTFIAEQCKRLVPKFLPDLTTETLTKVEQEIDAAATEQLEMERATKKAELQAIANPEPFGGAA